MGKKMMVGAAGFAALAAAGAVTVSMTATARAGQELGSAPEAATVADARTAAGVADTPAGSTERRNQVRVYLKDVNGKRVAQVDIVALRHGGNQVTVRAWNLAPGFHAIHIHAVGICTPTGAKPFASAGGHFNPTGKPEGMQAGAFPVLLAGANGQAQTEFTDANFAIRDLFGPTGTAVVIHSAPDNYANVPPRYTAAGVAGPDAETMITGDAGTRVACGVLSPSRGAPSASASPSAAPHASPSMPGMSMPGE